MIDLPDFGATPPLPGEVSIATLCDAVAAFIDEQGLTGSDTVGSSMGARMVLELARRGVGGTAVALDPGGFWSPGQQRLFGISIRASIKLIRALQPVLLTLTGNPVTRTLLLAQFSARPWALSPELVLRELRGYAVAPSFDAALVDGPLQQGAPPGSTPGPVVIGWGRSDRVTLPSQTERATKAVPGCPAALVRPLWSLPALGRPGSHHPADPHQHRLMPASHSDHHLGRSSRAGRGLSCQDSDHRDASDHPQVKTALSTLSALPVARRSTSALPGTTSEVLRSRIA